MQKKGYRESKGKTQKEKKKTNDGGRCQLRKRKFMRAKKRTGQV